RAISMPTTMASATPMAYPTPMRYRLEPNTSTNSPEARPAPRALTTVVNGGQLGLATHCVADTCHSSSSAASSSTPLARERPSCCNQRPGATGRAAAAASAAMHDLPADRGRQHRRLAQGLRVAVHRIFGQCGPIGEQAGAQHAALA